VTEPDDEQISVPAAAQLLDLQPHTLYDLIRVEQLGQMGEVADRPFYRLTRREVADFIARARIKPGDLRHLARPYD